MFMASCVVAIQKIQNVKTIGLTTGPSRRLSRRFWGSQHTIPLEDYFNGTDLQVNCTYING